MESYSFKVANVVLNFTTNCNRLTYEIQKDFEPYVISSTPSIDGRMEIIETDQQFPLDVPEFAIRETVVAPNSSIFSKNGLKFIVEGRERFFRIDFEKNEVIGYIKPSHNFLLHARIMFVRFLLKWMIIKSLEKKGTAFIHGSGVTKDNSSLCFIGPSGFGKTHILITLLNEKYKLITDDTILFRKGKVIPFHMRSKIIENLFDKFPILKQGLPPKSKKGTYVPNVGSLIDLADVFPVQKHEIEPSKLLYIYVWNSHKTKIEEISKKEMLSRLLHNYQVEVSNTLWSGYKYDEAMKKIFPIYNEFVDKVKCYKVFAGSSSSHFIKTIQET